MFHLQKFYGYVLLLMVIGWSHFSIAQETEMGEMELIERVAELQRQLESLQVAERDTAEKELLKLGTMVLDHLELPNDETPSDAIARTNRVRAELEKIAVKAVTEASHVTLAGNMTVAQALSAIRNQTGNDVNFTDEIPDTFADQKIDLKLQDADFWLAVSEISKLANLEIDPYAGQPGQLRLTPTRQARIAAANPGMEAPDPDDKADQQSTLPGAISGVFDLTVTKVSSSRNLLNPALNYCNITVQVRWEPRIQPISIDLPVESIDAIDEFDKQIVVNNEDAVISGIVQQEIPELELLIPIGLVDRQIENIKAIEATIDAVLPGRVETFRFKKIGNLKIGAEQRKAGAVVAFGGVRKNDDLFGITLRLSFDETHNALESHQGWAFNNPVHLENESGEIFEPVALETLRQDQDEMAIQFYFKEDPQDLTLVYKTAAAIVKVPIKFKLQNIPLP